MNEARQTKILTEIHTIILLSTRARVRGAHRILRKVELRWAVVSQICFTERGKSKSVLRKGGTTFGFGDGNVNTSVGVARAEICVRDDWFSGDVNVFDQTCTHPLSRKGIEKLEAVAGVRNEELQSREFGNRFRMEKSGKGHPFVSTWNTGRKYKVGKEKRKGGCFFGKC